MANEKANERPQAASASKAESVTQGAAYRARTRRLTIGREVALLIRNVSAIRLSLGEVIRSLHRQSEDARRAFNKIEKTILPSPDKNKKIERFAIPFQRVQAFQKAVERQQIVESSIKIVKEGHLLSLVSKWDLFISGILRRIYDAKPDIISSSERSLSFSQISSFSTIEEARLRIIDDEVEAVIRESHADQFLYLEKKMGVKLREGLTVWPQFIEITQRRNLIAHSGGRVSEQYIEVCRKHSCELPDQIRLGDVVGVSDEYLATAADCLIEIGVKLSQVVWNKMYPDELDAADDSFTGIAFSLIESEQYNVAARLLEFFLLPHIKHADERTKLVALINLAQSLKWMGNNEECLKILERHDWSTRSDDFQLADAVLKEDYIKAGKIMKRIGRSRSPTQNDYDNWPLFKRFRETEQYADNYRAIFGEQSEIDATGSQKPDMTSDHESTEDKRVGPPTNGSLEAERHLTVTTEPPKAKAGRSRRPAVMPVHESDR